MADPPCAPGPASSAARHPEARTLRGRGKVYVVPGPTGLMAVRHYHRGGAVAAPLLRDRYLRWDAFTKVRAELDPGGTFASDHLDRVLGPVD